MEGPQGFRALLGTIARATRIAKIRLPSRQRRLGMTPMGVGAIIIPGPGPGQNILWKESQATHALQEGVVDPLAYAQKPINRSPPANRLRAGRGLAGDHPA